MFGRKKQLAPALYNRPVAAAYLYAGELAQRAQALVYGEQPLVGEAITNGCVVSEGDGVWQMRTTESPFFGLLLLNFQQLAKALKADPVIQVRGFAYDREGEPTHIQTPVMNLRILGRWRRGWKVSGRTIPGITMSNLSGSVFGPAPISDPMEGRGVGRCRHPGRPLVVLILVFREIIYCGKMIAAIHRCYLLMLATHLRNGTYCC